MLAQRRGQLQIPRLDGFLSATLIRGEYDPFTIPGIRRLNGHEIRRCEGNSFHRLQIGFPDAHDTLRVSKVDRCGAPRMNTRLVKKSIGRRNTLDLAVRVPGKNITPVEQDEIEPGQGNRLTTQPKQQVPAYEPQADNARAIDLWPLKEPVLIRAILCGTLVTNGHGRGFEPGDFCHSQNGFAYLH